MKNNTSNQSANQGRTRNDSQRGSNVPSKPTTPPMPNSGSKKK